MDNNKLTTVSELMPHTIYTIRVEAYTAIGPGPPSPPVQVNASDLNWKKIELFCHYIISKVKDTFFHQIKVETVCTVLIVQSISLWKICVCFQVKTQQGVPSQPANLRATENRATSIKLAWEQPAHSGENIISYELYWNDSFANEVIIYVLIDY